MNIHDIFAVYGCKYDDFRKHINSDYVIYATDRFIKVLQISVADEFTYVSCE